MPSASLLWLRLDLRLSDNPALVAAVQHGGPVIPVYIHDPEAEGKWIPGGASNWWLHHALNDLGVQLARISSPLILRKGDTLAELQRLIEETSAGLVVWNRRYEPLIIQRDTAIKSILRNAGIRAESFNGNLLHEPQRIRTLTGNPFQVFTPFWKNCLANLKFGTPHKAPRQITAFERPLKSLPIEELRLLPKFPWDLEMRVQWEPTRAGAEKRLHDFVASSITNYPTHRDIPNLDGTSRLSPYLHFGQVSPLEIVDAVRASAKPEGKSSDKFLAEVGWREFAQHLIYHFPETADSPLRKEFANFPWAPDKAVLRAWQQGQTGYPIVDAGMRQLWKTGWQHNRVRMIAASVLVKHLLQPWQQGAKWYWDTLVDADLGANTMGWQWAGGCGADAAPYFRIFNPVLQGLKFDPNGEYVRRWVPELTALPSEWIHKPWEAPKHVLNSANITLGRDYPAPLIGLEEGRDRALGALKNMRTSDLEI